MAIRFFYLCTAVILCLFAPGAAQPQGYPGYPYSIMTPERGAGAHRHALQHRRSGTSETTAPAAAPPHRPSLLGREKFIAKLHRRGLYAARGSSGSVLPTPLPRTQLIPPEGGGTLTLPPLQQEQGPTRIPSQCATRPGNVSGPRFALRVSVRALRRARKSAYPVYGRVFAVKHVTLRRSARSADPRRVRLSSFEARFARTSG